MGHPVVSDVNMVMEYNLFPYFHHVDGSDWGGFRKWAPSAVSLEMVLRDEREMSDGFLLGPIHALARSL